MTRNQEKKIKQMVDKWLEAKGGTIEEREHRSAAWMKYFSELKVPKPVYLLAAATWLCSGAVILPEDMPKVEQAVRVAEINKVDPLRYDRPMAIIDAFPSTELKEAPIDPDSVPTLHLEGKFDSGLAIYNVDESQESRENMRKIINTHFGKESSPWCLLQGDGQGNLTKYSLQYWNHYNAYPKQVAFVDGKLVAFSANDNPGKIWWDRMDESSEKITMFRRKIKGDRLGRVADMEFDPKTGDVTYNDIHRYGPDGWGKECYSSLEDLVPKEIQDIADPTAVYVRIPDSVTRIGDGTFRRCTSLQEIHLPDGVTKIGADAFGGCFSLKEIHLPDGVTKIGQDTFIDCSSLREIHIPDGVTKIGDSAFKDCFSLQDIHIPDNVTEIGACAFAGCSSLREINIPEGVTEINFAALSGCSSLREINIPEGVTEIGYGAFGGCSSLREINIPEGVTKIDCQAFHDCSSLQEVHIPGSVTEINWDAFHGCSSLREIHISDGVTEIGDGAFEGCTSLREIRIPDSVTWIGKSAFRGCFSLQEIRIPDGVTEIGDGAFSGCSSLQEIHIPDSVTEIGYAAFRGCTSLREIHIPDSVTKISNYAFIGCTSLQEVHIPDGVTRIGERTFCGCTSLQKVHIPEGVTEIGDSAFRDCSSLQEVHIPDSVTEIGDDAFWGCTSLQKIHIPDSVTEISPNAFKDCTALREVRVSATAPLSLVEHLKERVPQQCVIIYGQPKIFETELAVLKEYGVSDKAIKTLQEKGSVHIKDNTFPRKSTETSPCPEFLKTVKTDILVVNKEGRLWVKAPDGTGNLGAVSSFFEKFKKRNGFIPKKPAAVAQEVKTLKIK